MYPPKKLIRFFFFLKKTQYRAAGAWHAVQVMRSLRVLVEAGQGSGGLLCSCLRVEERSTRPKSQPVLGFVEQRARTGGYWKKKRRAGRVFPMCIGIYFFLVGFMGERLCLSVLALHCEACWGPSSSGVVQKPLQKVVLGGGFVGRGGEG